MCSRDVYAVCVCTVNTTRVRSREVVVRQLLHRDLFAKGTTILLSSMEEEREQCASTDRPSSQITCDRSQQKTKN